MPNRTKANGFCHPERQSKASVPRAWIWVWQRFRPRASARGEGVNKHTKQKKGKEMKKITSFMGIFGAIMLAACDSNAGAKNGDTVVIDFAGFDNGVQFAGGTAENYPLKLGSGTFVPGFEEQLVGANVGDTRDVNIRFPDNYVPELAGHEVVFKVTIKEIQSK